MQQQNRPGLEKNMTPVPETVPLKYPKEGKLKNKVALITGGDSGFVFPQKVEFDGKIFKHLERIL